MNPNHATRLSGGLGGRLLDGLAGCADVDTGVLEGGEEVVHIGTEVGEVGLEDVRVARLGGHLAHRGHLRDDRAVSGGVLQGRSGRSEWERNRKAEKEGLIIIFCLNSARRGANRTLGRRASVAAFSSELMDLREPKRAMSVETCWPYDAMLDMRPCEAENRH